MLFTSGVPKSLFKISPRMSWRRIFRPDCVKNPCHPSGCLRIFALQGKKSTRQSIHVEILEAVPIGDGMQIGKKNFCLARKKLAGILTDFKSF